MIWTLIRKLRNKTETADSEEKKGNPVSLIEIDNNDDNDTDNDNDNDDDNDTESMLRHVS